MTIYNRFHMNLSDIALQAQDPSYRKEISGISIYGVSVLSYISELSYKKYTDMEKNIKQCHENTTNSEAFHNCMKIVYPDLFSKK